MHSEVYIEMTVMYSSKQNMLHVSLVALLDVTHRLSLPIFG